MSYFNIYSHMLETYILLLFDHWIKHEKGLHRQFTEKNINRFHFIYQSSCKAKQQWYTFKAKSLTSFIFLKKENCSVALRS